MMLSAHLSADAFCITQARGIANVLPEALYPNAKRTAALWEGLMEVLGFGAIALTSGYRCPTLNRRIGGHPKSAHVAARAVDFVPLHVGAATAVDRIRRSALLFDKVLMESARGRMWVHAQVERDGATARRLAYMTFDGVAFAPFDPSDPRVQPFT